MPMSPTRYEAVIGLEVHAQLLTRTKAFCGCSTTYGAVRMSRFGSHQISGFMASRRAGLAFGL